MDNRGWEETVAKIKEASDAVDKAVTEGVSTPIGRRSTLNLAMPNWEDPRLQLTIPASSPIKPTVRFSLGVDLTWHDVINDFQTRLLNDLIGQMLSK